MLINAEKTAACPRFTSDATNTSTNRVVREPTSSVPHPQMAKRSLSLPGRPSGFSLMDRNTPLSQRRKRVHWCTDLEEVIYFAPDTAIRRYDLSTMRSFDRRVRILRSRSTSVNKRLPLKASQTLARSINDANSTLFCTGVDIFSHQLDRLKSRSENLKLFDDQVNNRRVKGNLQYS